MSVFEEASSEYNKAIEERRSKEEQQREIRRRERWELEHSQLSYAVAGFERVLNGSPRLAGNAIAGEGADASLGHSTGATGEDGKKQRVKVHVLDKSRHMGEHAWELTFPNDKGLPTKVNLAFIEPKQHEEVRDPDITSGRFQLSRPGQEPLILRLQGSSLDRKTMTVFLADESLLSGAAALTQELGDLVNDRRELRPPRPELSSLKNPKDNPIRFPDGGDRLVLPPIGSQQDRPGTTEKESQSIFKRISSGLGR